MRCGLGAGAGRSAASRVLYRPLCMSAQGDYVLGTHDQEVARLGIQHAVWRERVRRAWQRAGITTGSRVIDVGAGPGWATADLAEVVGPSGRVLALERSARFVEVNRRNVAQRGFAQVEVHRVDLMADAIPATGYDAAWCRWVACFVSDPALLVRRIHAALAPGGRVIFHEYCCYSAFRLAPRRPAVEEWVAQVMASWRAEGGEPDIGMDLVGLLAAQGFAIEHAQPVALAAHPGEPLWEWPASFIGTNLDRLLQLGRVDAAWCARVRAEWEAAQAEKTTLCVMPLLLELVARKR